MTAPKFCTVCLQLAPFVTVHPPYPAEIDTTKLTAGLCAMPRVIAGCPRLLPGWAIPAELAPCRLVDLVPVPAGEAAP